MQRRQEETFERQRKVKAEGEQVSHRSKEGFTFSKTKGQAESVAYARLPNDNCFPYSNNHFIGTCCLTQYCFLVKTLGEAVVEVSFP